LQLLRSLHVTLLFTVGWLRLHVLLRWLLLVPIPHITVVLPGLVVPPRLFGCCCPVCCLVTFADVYTFTIALLFPVVVPIVVERCCLVDYVMPTLVPGYTFALFGCTFTFTTLIPAFVVAVPLVVVTRFIYTRSVVVICCTLTGLLFTLFAFACIAPFTHGCRFVGFTFTHCQLLVIRFTNVRFCFVTRR